VRRYDLFAPDLLTAECANVLWKKHRLGEITAREASLAARLLERAEVEFTPMRRLLDRAVGLAVALSHPAYDCMYLACAEAAHHPFVTADARLARKLTELGVANPVEVAPHASFTG
jgi:predicted nucleic acid-binding protein